MVVTSYQTAEANGVDMTQVPEYLIDVYDEILSWCRGAHAAINPEPFSLGCKDADVVNVFSDEKKGEMSKGALIAYAAVSGNIDWQAILQEYYDVADYQEKMARPTMRPWTTSPASSAS